MSRVTKYAPSYRFKKCSISSGKSILIARNPSKHINTTSGQSFKLYRSTKFAFQLHLFFHVPSNVTLLVYNVCFDDTLTVILSIFISGFNQLDAQNLFHNKLYFTPLHVSSKRAHHQEVKTALHRLWYHHTYCTGMK